MRKRSLIQINKCLVSVYGVLGNVVGDKDIQTNEMYLFLSCSLVQYCLKQQLVVYVVIDYLKYGQCDLEIEFYVLFNFN